MALGMRTMATGNNSVALGAFSSSTGNNEVSIGNAVSKLTRKLVNLSAGDVSSTSTDAVNGSQLYETNENVAQNATDIAANRVDIDKNTVKADGAVAALGGGAGVGADGEFIAPNFKDALGATSDINTVYDGFSYLKNNINNIANGKSANDGVNVSQLKPVIDGLGGGTKIDDSGVVTGPSYNVTNKDGDTVTVNNVGDALDTINDNVNNNTAEIGGIKDVIGGNWNNCAKPTFNGKDTIKEAIDDIGGKVTDIESNIDGITKGESGLIQLGKDKADNTALVVDNDLAKDAGAFDISGGPDGNRTLTGVKDCEIASDSKDAVNGSQLYDTNKVMANIIGGGMMLNDDGSLSYPNNKFQVGDKYYNNIAEAIKDAGSGGDQLFRVEKDDEGNVTQIGINNSGDAGKTNTISFANGSVARKVTGVAPGEISATSTDAINGSQLHVVKEDINNINYTLNHYNTRMNTIEKKVHENRKVASAGIAGAMAMSSIPYVEYSKYSFGMGIGYYDGESAISIGFQGKVNDRARYRLQMSYDTQNKVGLGAGVAFEL